MCAAATSFTNKFRVTALQVVPSELLGQTCKDGAWVKANTHDMILFLLNLMLLINFFFEGIY